MIRYAATLARSILVGARFFIDDAKDEAVATAEELFAQYPYAIRLDTVGARTDSAIDAAAAADCIIV
jgi:hypothetical protein